MGSSNKQICRLCLEITPVCESEAIDESKKKLLKFLLIAMDYDLSDYAVVCIKCVEKLQDSFNFKSRVSTFMDIGIKVNIKKDVKMEMSETLCRFCMSFIQHSVVDYPREMEDGIVFNDIIRHCFPKVDMSNESLICISCLNSMKIYYKFMKRCQEVEERIEHYCQVVGCDFTNRVILEDVLKFKNCNTLTTSLVIKKECPDVEDNVKVTFSKNEHVASIKHEEIDIKEEYIGVNKSEADHSEDCNSSGKDNSSKRKRRIKKSVSKEKEHFCPKCPYSSNKSHSFKSHLRSHSDNEVHECFVCHFVSNAKLLLRDHMASHRGPTKIYGCHNCSYETDHRASLVRHFLIHKDKSEVEMHKCPLCAFGSKRKSGVLHHQLVHKKPEEVLMHKCEICRFESKYQTNLDRHMGMHRDLDIHKFKCDKWPY